MNKYFRDLMAEREPEFFNALSSTEKFEEFIHKKNEFHAKEESLYPASFGVSALYFSFADGKMLASTGAEDSDEVERLSSRIDSLCESGLGHPYVYSAYGYMSYMGRGATVVVVAEFRDKYSEESITVLIQYRGLSDNGWTAPNFEIKHKIKKLKS